MCPVRISLPTAFSPLGGLLSPHKKKKKKKEKNSCFLNLFKYESPMTEVVTRRCSSVKRMLLKISLRWSLFFYKVAGRETFKNIFFYRTPLVAAFDFKVCTTVNSRKRNETNYFVLLTLCQKRF